MSSQTLIETPGEPVAAGTADGGSEFLEFVPLAGLRPGKWSLILRKAEPGEIKTLRQSVIERGVLQPLIITESGQIVDGHLRYRIARDLGLETLPCRKELFDSEEQVEVMVLTLQLGRRNLTPAERDELIGRLYKLRKKRRGGDRRSDQWAKVAHELQGNTAEALASEHGISPRTVKNAAGRVTFTDRYPQFKSDPTGDVLDLKNYLPRLQRRKRENLLDWASVKELNAKEVLQAARLIAECGESAREAIEAVCDRTAAELLAQLAPDTSEQPKESNSAVADGGSDMMDLLDGLVDILTRGATMGYDMEEFPWPEMRSLIQRFRTGPVKDIKPVRDSKEEGHERCD